MTSLCQPVIVNYPKPISIAPTNNSNVFLKIVYNIMKNIITQLGDNYELYYLS